MKVWQAKDLAIPMVKMEMTAEVMGMKMEVLMEMTEAGSGKEPKKDAGKDEKKDAAKKDPPKN